MGRPVRPPRGGVAQSADCGPADARGETPEDNRTVVTNENRLTLTARRSRFWCARCRSMASSGQTLGPDGGLRSAGGHGELPTRRDGIGERTELGIGHASASVEWACSGSRPRDVLLRHNRERRGVVEAPI
jgi:hypothetical protein